MKANEKETVQNIVKAMLLLPADKQEFIKGYAEGVIAMGNAARLEDVQPQDRAG